MSETVSCIIPAYNAERFLAEALESAFAQTHPMLEVIVVDDGSTDGTAAVATGMGDRVRLVTIAHQGYPAGRDAGLAVARGEYIAFLDADDLWVPDKTARQLAVLRQRPDIDLCVAHYQNFWDEEIADEEARYIGHPLSKPLSGYIAPTLVAPRRTFQRFGRFSEAAHPTDTGWFAAAIARGATLETLPDVLLRRRLHRTNHSRVTAGPDGLFELINTRRRARTVTGGPADA